MAPRLSQKHLQTFFDRRHPRYDDLLAHWIFIEATYKGGRSWFSPENIHRYLKEGDREYGDRLKRAYRFNHSREVVDLVQKYLFKGKITRNLDEAPEELQAFWKSCSLSGFTIDQFVRSGSTRNSVQGRVAVVVDNNFDIPDPEQETVTERIAERATGKVYAYVVGVKDILDYAWDEDGDGELLWCKLREYARDDRDPIKSSYDMVERVRLWTRNDWSLFEVERTPVDIPANVTDVVKRAYAAAAPVTKVRRVGYGVHGLGFVPVKMFDHTDTDEPYESRGLIDDTAYMDRAVANYLSNLDAIIQDQTFSQLTIPAQALQAGEDQHSELVRIGTSRILAYDAGAGSTASPEYISPDPKQAGVILTVVNKIISEIYHTIGLAGERTKEDNAVGIDNSSGVAKAYDFERVNSLLYAKGQSCQRLENWMARTVMAWHGKSLDADLVTYPTTFDIARLTDEISVAVALLELRAPMEVRRAQMMAIIDKIFPQLSKDLLAKLKADVAAWDDTAPEELGAKTPSSKAPDSRQGEVTEKTK